MTAPTKPAVVALPPVIPGVSGMQGTGHLPADERASIRAAREERRKAADARAAKEEAERNAPKHPHPAQSMPEQTLHAPTSRGHK